METRTVNYQNFTSKITRIKELFDNEERKLHIKLHRIAKPWKISSYVEYSNGLKYSFFSSINKLGYLSQEKALEQLLNKLEKYTISIVNDTNVTENLYSILWKYDDSEVIYTTNIFAKHIIILIEKFHFRDFEKPRDILNIAKMG